ncbi:MAG: cytochrome P450 [Bauldia sp.]
MGPFVRAVRRQILEGEHLVAWDGAGIQAYAGWLPTTGRIARAWLAGEGKLEPADKSDAAALTTVAASDPRLLPGLMRAARDLAPGVRIYFKRSYTDADKRARKAAVLNVARPARVSTASADATPIAAARPPIADDPCGFLYALAGQEPGKTVRVPLGAGSVLVVQDATQAAHVLVGNGANYHKNFVSFTPLLGASRLTVDGDRWRRSQRLSQPAIAPHDVGRAEGIILRHYSALVPALLDGAAGGAPIDPAIDRAAVGTLLDLAFSADIRDFYPAFIADLRTSIRFSARRAWDSAGVPPIVDESERAAAEAAVDRIRRQLGELVRRRRQQPTEGRDALSALVEASAGAVDSADENRIDLMGELVTLIVAGSDTTSAAIGWALSILAEHPEFQEQLRDEIVATIGSRAPTLADVEAVGSLRPFLSETLRMFPPVPILSRFAVAADSIGEYAVAPGDLVLVSVIGLHQDPAIWDEPRAFQLERHQGEALSRPDRRSVFMAFSSGPRICGGARFAQMEMSLAIMLILQRCRLDLPQPLPLAFEWGASMRRRGGQRIGVTAR